MINSYVEEMKKRKRLITSYDTDTQKHVAVCMWGYVRSHLDELHDILTDEQRNYASPAFGYKAVEEIKKKFVNKFEDDTGIEINWKTRCILCEKFDHMSQESCFLCPLRSCSSFTFDNPYYILVSTKRHMKGHWQLLTA